NARRHAGRVAEVDPSKARRPHECRPRRGVDAGRLAFQPAVGPAAEPAVVPLVTGGADELESSGKVPAGPKGREAGKQVATHQVPGAAEDDEPFDHVEAGRLAALASVTPAAITPM